MVIDIISYTDEQFAVLSEEQLLEVQQAQLKKNRLKAALDEDMQKEKFRLIDNGIFLSTIWRLVQWKLNKTYESEVQNIRDSLLFYLRYSSKPETGEAEEAPYTVDYSLSDTERFNIVKEYYETNYSDGEERFEVFKADTVAVKYLGELYAPLYDYFLSMT